MEFWRESEVRARRPHRCEACNQQIEVGAVHAYMVGKYEGDFFTTRQHRECRDAEVGLAQLHGLRGGEDWIFLHDLDDSADLDWIERNHPAAFGRIVERYSHWREDEDA